MEPSLGLFARLWLAWVVYFRVLFDADTAGRVKGALAGLPAPAPTPAATLPAPTPSPAPRPAAPPKPDASAALHLLSILQREGRFVDFLQEDVAGVPDEQVGAGARVVQQGCKKALASYLRLEPVRTEEEGAPITLEAGFDAGAVRLTGNVVGQPPFRGRLAHHGWRAADVRWPAPPEGIDPHVLAPAEVELA